MLPIPPHVKINTDLFIVEKCNQKIRQLVHKFTKMPKAISRPKGEDWPNPVTLLRSADKQRNTFVIKKSRESGDFGK
jgi:hypothetical protein